MTDSDDRPPSTRTPARRRAAPPVAPPPSWSPPYRDADEDDDGEMIEMPFGRFQGQLVSTLPRDYLCWLQTATIYSRRLAAAIDQAHRRFCTLSHDKEWR